VRKAFETSRPPFCCSVIACKEGAGDNVKEPVLSACADVNGADEEGVSWQEMNVGKAASKNSMYFIA
jgi:hypothetical protein